ncbi:MAG: lysophospholipid acyltransferase family protein [Sulfurimonas sp.]
MLDIEQKILKKYPKLKNSKLLKSAVTKFADSLIHQDEINKFVEKNTHLGSYEFIDEVLEYFNFNFHVKDKEIENIPSSGRVVIIANHPLGALDALSLIKLVSKVRKDIKVIANDFLEEFENLKPILINIDAFGGKQKKESIQKVYDALENEEAVIIFPSGEVSRATPTGIKDKKWKKGFLKFAHRTHAPILPIYIGGKNSKTFYSISALNKKLSTALLPNEMFKQRDNTIEIVVGELIPAENTNPKGIKLDQLVNLYKKHLYSLKSKKNYFETQKAIAHPEDAKAVKKELKKSQLLGKTKDGKLIYLYASDDKNSIVVNEIGRLREISYRKVGEGINKKRDIDKYDRYYKHIILWDNEDLEIVGAYRIAECAWVLENKCMTDLYTTTLFDYNEEFLHYLYDSIELGRSFVQPKYWGSRALDYLWYGIGAYLKNNPQIKYMFGPVSLSATLPQPAKDMILYYYDTYYGDKGTLVDAKIPYNFKSDKSLIKRLEGEFNSEDLKQNFKTLKRSLSTIGASVPTLYKQYSDLCEQDGIKFCAYNVDPDFSDCIDSFIVVEIDKIKQKQRERYFGA